MSEHVKQWVIAAYADGELADPQRQQVAAHIAACVVCQADLESVRALSRLLQTDVLPGQSVAQQEAFAAAVLARLSRPQRPLWVRAMHLSWRYAPVGLFAVWAFVQVVLGISGVLLSLLPPSLLPFAPGTQSPTMLSLLLGALWNLLQPPPGVQSLVNLLSKVPVVNTLTLLNLLLAMLIGVLFLAWMASIWAARRTVDVDNIFS